MPSPSTQAEDIVVAREAVVVNVGGRPAEWAKITVKDRRTRLDVEILDTDSPPVVEQEVGTSYAFREGQREPSSRRRVPVGLS